MFCKSDIANLKTNMGDIIGKEVIIKGSLGRSKTFEKKATIDKMYSEIFSVKYEGNDRPETYSYKDILTRTVELNVFDGENYTPLIPSL